MNAAPRSEPPRTPARRKTKRGAIALGVLVLWLGALALLARRELFRPKGELLAEAALRINPGAVYFAVLRSGEQIGFASSTIDTTAKQITATDYLVADVPLGGEEKRAEARAVVTLTRALRVDSFTVSLETDSIPFLASGRVIGDTALVLALGDSTSADTSHIKLTEPVLLPTLVPLAVILGGVPKVGGKTVLSVFDPVEQAPKKVSIEILAESVFVVSDSARLDSAARRWVTAHDDTVRAWRIRTDGAPAFIGWVDEQGRLVQADVPGGLSIERRAYEISFENWKLDAHARGTRVTADRDILETTAIASNRMVRVNRLQELKVRLHGTSLAGFVISGGRQRMSGDTMIVRRESPGALTGVPRHRDSRQWSDSIRQYLRAEPLLPRTPEIAAAARRIVGTESDPTEQVRLLNKWVHDSLVKRTTIGVPNAQTVLRTRIGDCNEHAQLFTAMARFLGIPTRVAAGLAYVDGKFYYHAWPEVYLTDWVAVDPTFGQVPADAGHLRFTVGGLSRQAELLRLIGTLKIDVVSAR